MIVNYKLILIAIIAFSTTANVFASQTSLDRVAINNNSVKSEFIDNNKLPQQNDFSKIKTSITNSNPNNYQDETTRYIVDQLYKRFEETTEYNGINSISGQSVDVIKNEISKLNDNNLKVNNLKMLSNALLEFIAKGSLTYGEIKPDIALEYYNSINEKKLDKTTVEQQRQLDIKEIEARETLQAIEKFYDNIKVNPEEINPSTIEQIKYIGNVLSKSTDSKIKNALIDMFMGQEDNIELPNSLTSEEIKDLKTIIKDRKILPKEQWKVVNGLKKLGNRIKNIFKKDSKKQYNENINTLQTNNISNNDETQSEIELMLSDSITQDEITDIIVENSNLFE